MVLTCETKTLDVVEISNIRFFIDIVTIYPIFIQNSPIKFQPNVISVSSQRNVLDIGSDRTIVCLNLLNFSFRRVKLSFVSGYEISSKFLT